MANLYIMNCTPWSTYIQLNGIQNTPQSPLDPSEQSAKYFPYSEPLVIDLANNSGNPDTWGRTNNLTVKWSERSVPNTYENLANPPGLEGQDLYLWVLVDELIMSQGGAEAAHIRPN